MNSKIVIMLIVILLIFFAIDWYIFGGIKTLTGDLVGVSRNIVLAVYWIISGSIYIFMFYAFLNYDPQTGPGKIISTFMSIAILFFVPKLIYGVFLLAEDVFRMIFYGLDFSTKHLSGSKESIHLASRRKFLSQIGIGIAAVPFGAILHGLIRGQYKFTLHRITMQFPDLPDAFDGFKIIQLSDIHSGGFDSKSGLQKGIDLINDQNADMILFTGDLVNNLAGEVDPWEDQFKMIKEVPYGKYSVLGNHDYGEYIQWPNEEAKNANFEEVKNKNSKIGFRLLLNENIKIEKNGQSIRLLGVENWGLPPFPQYGDIDKALGDARPEEFKILMSHDPTHWDEKVLTHPQKIHLTLSGHTHGMQFGIEIPGFRWSPVKYRYPRWAGKFDSEGQNLYVNRGFGCLGFPGRVGIWPEVCLITLKKG